MKKFCQFVFICIFSFSAPLFADWQNELKTKIAQGNYPTWMMDQIHEDLAPFKEAGITEQNIWKTMEMYPTHGFILCQIHKNRFSWRGYPSSTGQDFRAMMLADAMQKLCQAIHLPDVIFIVFIGESFCDKGFAPVFSWCKHESWSSVTVAFPDYEALSGNYNFLHEAQVGANRYPWQMKQNIALWRGSNAGGYGFDFMPRLKLVQASAQYPQFIEAKFSGLFEAPNNAEEKNYLGMFMSIPDQLMYKYQILMDGHVSAFSRAYWQLFSNCVIFKHVSPWYQWFYRALRPYEHYVPFQADGSDLVQKIQWAREHDNEMRMISQRANDFANNNLKHADILLYVYLLLNEYAKLQRL